MISANAGAFSLTGFVANLVYVPSVGYVLDAQPATYALLGADAGVVTTRMVNAQSGIFALTGTAATLLQSGAGFGRPVTMKFTVRKRKARMELN